jgi:ABC-type transporter Mla subunit MlaD
LSPTTTLPTIRETVDNLNTLLDDLIAHGGNPDIIDALDMVAGIGAKFISGDDDIGRMTAGDFCQQVDQWREDVASIVDAAEAEQMRLLEVA